MRESTETFGDPYSDYESDSDDSGSFSSSDEILGSLKYFIAFI